MYPSTKCKEKAVVLGRLACNLMINEKCTQHNINIFKTDRVGETV